MLKSRKTYRHFVLLIACLAMFLAMGTTLFAAEAIHTTSGGSVGTQDVEISWITSYANKTAFGYTYGFGKPVGAKVTIDLFYAYSPGGSLLGPKRETATHDSHARLTVHSPTNYLYESKLHI